ncbi:hypothetical protein EDC04DRAFT_2607234 [Pisolithus marmoratus]|nr:hypothetical protein EDC04DRAFT_2607234 [Pisolithus marmoratus]
MLVKHCTAVHNCTFNALLRPITVGARAQDDHIIETMRMITRRGKHSQSLQSIYILFFVVKELLYMELIPYLDLIEWQWVMEVLRHHTQNGVVQMVLSTFQELPNHRAKGWLSHEMKSGGNGGEGMIWYQSSGNGATHKGVGDDEHHVVMERVVVRINLDIMLLLQFIVIFTGIILVAGLNICGNIKTEALVRAIEIAGYLVVVVLIVAQPSRNLDLLNMGMLSSISRPLDDGP